MPSEIKSKPSDGSESEDDEKLLEDYVNDADQEYAETQKRKKSNFNSLKRDRGYGEKDPENDDEAKSKVENPFHKAEGETNNFAAFALRKRAGIFGGGTKRVGFGYQSTTKKIERTLKAGATGISIKKQREFMQMLGKYHGLKRTNLSTLDKEEVVKFESGLRHGTSDERFKKFCNQLKEEGVIKNTQDVKKLFNKNDTRKMSDVLMGRKTTALRVLGKAGLMERRARGSDAKPTNHT